MSSNTSETNQMELTTTRKCGNCGETGHNKRKCPYDIRVTPIHTETTRKCGNCGEVGHNKRQCTHDVVVHEPTKSIRKCGNCGEVGHNKRQCTHDVVVHEPTKSIRKCGNCKEFGHNKRNCTYIGTYEDLEMSREITKDPEDLLVKPADIEDTEVTFENPDRIARMQSGDKLWQIELCDTDIAVRFRNGHNISKVTRVADGYERTHDEASDYVQNQIDNKLIKGYEFITEDIPNVSPVDTISPDPPVTINTPTTYEVPDNVIIGDIANIPDETLVIGNKLFWVQTDNGDTISIDLDWSVVFEPLCRE